MPSSILVIEDEPAISELISVNLQHAGHCPIRAYNAEQAQNLISDVLPDLVLLDWMLPGKSGIAFARELRGNERTKHIPIIMLTARGDEQDKVLGLEIGADDYVTKPFAFAELLVRVKALLRRGPVNRESTLGVGDLEMDRLTKQVKRAGRKLDVTAKEYALLEYLMQNADRVLSRGMIIEHVWDQSFDGITNIVDVYVRHLRGKVDDGFLFKMIRTVRGSGYVIRSSAREPGA